ncbi:Fe(3+)-hydroxamate ABC transporter permease FhuB [Shinella sp. CPCC 100929]|uniref:Fe(3+)-hydroxamate ABC transporter permease FhuB n=2 Tax=Shinella lacus TaxID=2654216 RepID=A0ABT1R0N0_9HYPH|nr:Fe(3+)-hydroxamate ABC transporter permease FhuB [Shinella lacus]
MLPVMLCGLSLFGLVMIGGNILSVLPGNVSIWAVVSPQADATEEILLHYTLLPRIVVALMAGAALGVAGSILQRVLRNPLAEPATLGVSAGSYLTLTIATLWFPLAASNAAEWVALAGAALALAAILGLSWRKGLSPATVTLSGMIVSLYCGAASAVLMLFNHDFLTGIYLWGAGYLDQQDWSGVLFLAPRLLVAIAVAALIQRPLALLSLDDSNARSLGLNIEAFRLLSLLVAAVIIAVVTAAVGVISFIGLAVPALARATGARSPGREMAWSAIFGALVLTATDQCVQALPVTYRIFPTGAVTALMGAPLLLVLVRRLKSLSPPAMTGMTEARRLRWPWTVIALAAVALGIALLLSVFAGRGPSGWHVMAAPEGVYSMRTIRSVSAVAGGAMLALAGAILQRMTGNPLGSPEVLGVSSGAMLGVIAATLSVTAVSRGLQISAGAVGAGITLAFIMALARKGDFQGDRLLLIGVTLSSISGFVMAVLMAAQDPRLDQLLAWMSGSTYAVRKQEAIAAVAILGAGLAVGALLRRWLEILPLGETVALSQGVSFRSATAILLLLSAVLTAAATILVGPLSFAGLMGPHLARLAGFQRPAAHLFASALVGGAILLGAEWLGRNIIFPYQIPAGLLATVVGGPFLLLLIGRRL